MIIDTELDENIASYITEYYKKKSKLHTPSGKLSATMLAWPLQWQVLKYLGVPQPEKEQYVLRKFLRGEHVENFITLKIPNIEAVQVKLDYNGVVGIADAVSNGTAHEIKSVSNAKYSRILKDKKADYQHILQAGFYALALHKSQYAIHYVAADDYRTTSFIYDDVEELKDTIDSIIKLYNAQIKAKRVPRFNAVLEWQANSNYNSYPEFLELDEDQAEKLLKDKYNIKWPKEDEKK